LGVGVVRKKGTAAGGERRRRRTVETNPSNAEHHSLKFLLLGKKLAQVLAT